MLQWDATSVLYSKSLYISSTMSIFYGIQIEIWTGLGPDGITKKKFWLIMSNFERHFFYVFIDKKRFFSLCTKKSHKMKLNFLKINHTKLNSIMSCSTRDNPSSNLCIIALPVLKIISPRESGEKAIK